MYRLTKDAMQALFEQLRPHVRQHVRRSAIPLELKTLASLHFLPLDPIRDVKGKIFLSCMCQASVSKSIHAIVTALNILMRNWIQFPTRQHEINAVKQQFWEKCQFPGVIGAVDGTHIAIWPPENHREYLYINRKLYHSINVLLVSNYDGQILAVNARHGGRTHDARVWNASTISVHLQQRYRNGETGTWLLGDSGYPLLPYLMTPKLNVPDGSPSARYTEAHIKARSAIERTIGILKGRWRCLRKERALHYTPGFSALIINACCVLHNMAKFYIVPIPEPCANDVDEEENVQVVEEVRGIEVRERIIQWYFT